MRCKDKMLRLSLSQIPRTAGKRVESIRVQNNGKLRLTNECSNETLRFTVNSNPGTHGKKSLAPQKRTQTRAFSICRGDRARFCGSKRFGHEFRLRRSNHGKNYIRRCDRKQS